MGNHDEIAFELNLLFNQTKRNVGSALSGYISKEEIDFFFNPQSSVHTLLFNNAGETYIEELANYALFSLLPLDGSWLRVTADALPESQAQEIAFKIFMRLIRSNFYTEMKSAITNYYLYKRAALTLDWTTNPVFESHAPNRICFDAQEGALADEFFIEERRNIVDIDRLYTDLPMDFEKLGVLSENKKSMYYTVVNCVLPAKHDIVRRLEIQNRSDYNYFEIPMMVYSGLPSILTPVNGFMGSKTVPVSAFGGRMSGSVASKAYKKASLVNLYEKFLVNRAEIASNPPFQASVRFWKLNGQYSIGPGDTLSQPDDTQIAQPVETKMNFPVEDAAYQRVDLALRDVFKIDLIRQVSAVGISQAEYHAMQTKVVNSVYPEILIAFTNVVESCLTRFVAILKTKDKSFSQYKSLNLDIVSLVERMRAWRLLTTVAHYGQAAKLAITADPKGQLKVNGPGILDNVASALGVPEFNRDDQEVEDTMQGSVESENEMMDKEAANQQSLVDTKGQWDEKIAALRGGKQ